MKRAIFLDRDGTIIVEKNYLSAPNDVQLIPGAAEAIMRLNQAQYLVVVVSNQSGVARGMYSEKEVQAVNDRMCTLLAKNGATVNAVYYCPHHPNGTVSQYTYECKCRKPQIGMAEQAEQEWDIDLTQSYMIGDKLVDIQFGQAFGARQSFLVQTGHGREEGKSAVHTQCVANIVEAIDVVLQMEKIKKGKNR